MAISKTTDRRWGARVPARESHSLCRRGARPAAAETSRRSCATRRNGAIASAGTRQTPLAPAAPGRGIAPPRRRRKMREATPVAATSSTAISPTVSQARMSTRVTLTTFLPPPYSYASAGKSTETGGWVRAEGITRAAAPTVSPTATATPSRTQRLAASGRTEKYAGSRRSTSTKTTSVIVSTRTWVRARSGAPCSRKIAAAAEPADAEQDDGLEAAAGPGGEHRGAGGDGARDGLRRRVPQADRVQAGQPGPGEHRPAGGDHHEDEDRAEVERQRATLGGGGDVGGEVVQAAHDAPVDLVGVRRGGDARLPALDR